MLLVPSCSVTAVAFWWYDRGLGDLDRAPYCGLPWRTSATTTREAVCGWLVTDVFWRRRRSA